MTEDVLGGHAKIDEACDFVDSDIFNALEHLETERIARQPQIDLFAGGAPASADTAAADGGEKPAAAAVANSALGEAVAALDPDILTPREALDALYRLKALHRDTS